MRPSHLIAILDREFLSTAAGKSTPVMVWGPPGIGKSQIVTHVAKQHSVPVIDIRLSQMEPTDLRGIPFRDDDTVVWSIPALLPNAKRHGECGILFLDEITSAPPTVTAAAYQLILDRRLGEYRVPDGWAIFAAGNRHGDRGVTYAMPAPLANRFTHYELEAYLDDWIAWAYRNEIDERVIAFLHFRPELLFDMKSSATLAAFPSPRTWEYASRALRKFNDAPELLLEGLQACVGVAAGIEFKAFMDHIRDLPDIEAIANGKSHEVPGAIDLQYAVASSLVRRVVREAGKPNSDTMIGNVLRYAKLFPQRELGIMLVSDLQRALGTPLLDSPEFSEWASSISDLLMYRQGH
jgi:AAA domain (dynein-related subfamily)